MTGFAGDFQYADPTKLSLSNESSLCQLEELNAGSLSILNVPQVIIKAMSDKTCFKLPFEWTIFLCVVYLLIFLFGFLGNALVIIVISCKQRMKTVTNLFIFNLAVADLLVILFCVPANLLSNIFIPWILGGFLCKSVSYIQGVSVFSSVYSLVAISLERCEAIRKPLRLSRRLSKSQALVTIIFVWITGLIIFLPWTVFFDVTYHPLSPNDSWKFPFCTENWVSKNHELGYFLFINLFFCYMFPLVTITVSNLTIWKSVPLRQLPSQSNSVYSNMEEIHRRTKLSVLKMVTGLTFMFFICWLPLYVVMTIVKLSGDPSNIRDLLKILVPLSQILGSCNSCVNPIMYAFLNPKFWEVCRLPDCLKVKRFVRAKGRNRSTRKFREEDEDENSLSFILTTRKRTKSASNFVSKVAVSPDNYSMTTVSQAITFTSVTALAATPIFLQNADVVLKRKIL